jgi:hypothetical protein
MYDPRIARLLSVDPLTKDYPWYTPYQFAGNTPIQAIDLLGEQPAYVTRKYLSSPNSGGVDPSHPEFNAELKKVEANTVNVAALLRNEDVHGGNLTVTYDKPGGKIVSANWTGYKKKSFVEKNFTSSAYADAGWEGKEGLKKYSNALNNTGNTLTAASLASGPAAPVVAGLGKGLSIASDGINTALDFKNKDLSTALKNTGIRVGVFLGGQYIQKQFEMINSRLPKSLGDETLGLDKLKDTLTEE